MHKKRLILRRLAGWLLILWMLTGIAALAEAPEGWLDALTETERTLLFKLADYMEMDHSSDTLWPLYCELFDQGDAEGMIGWLTGDVYTHPEGFQMMVPYSWSVMEMEEDATVALMAEADEAGYAVKLRVSLAPAEEPLSLEEDHWQAILSQEYEGFTKHTFDEIVYHGVPAVEFVFQYTDAEGRECVQQHFVFQENDVEYIIRLDMLLDDAFDEELLTIYDTFLQRFTVGV